MIVHVFIAALAAFTSVASADTFVPARGSVDTTHANRCASPSSVKRLTDFIKLEPQVTVGHGQMTVYTDVVDSDGEHHRTTTSANRLADITGHVGLFDKAGEHGGMLTIIVDVMPVGWCTEPRICASWVSAMRVAILQRFDGAECYEVWFGDARKL